MGPESPCVAWKTKPKSRPDENKVVYALGDPSLSVRLQ